MHDHKTWINVTNILTVYYTGNGHLQLFPEHIAAFLADFQQQILYLCLSKAPDTLRVDSLMKLSLLERIQHLTTQSVWLGRSSKVQKQLRVIPCGIPVEKTF